jgi:hypothetical protein
LPESQTAVAVALREVIGDESLHDQQASFDGSI